MTPPPISHSTALIGAHQVTPMSLSARIVVFSRCTARARR
jgi:hypothetical protein